MSFLSKVSNALAQDVTLGALSKRTKGDVTMMEYRVFPVIIYTYYHLQSIKAIILLNAIKPLQKVLFGFGLYYIINTLLLSIVKYMEFRRGGWIG